MMDEGEGGQLKNGFSVTRQRFHQLPFFGEVVIVIVTG